MTSKSETGHAKNVANFESLISFCIGYNADYNPSNAALKISALQTLQTNAANSLLGVNTKKSIFQKATDARQAEFDPFKKLATKVINALDATEASSKTVKDAKTINNKIQGKRADNKAPSTSPSETEAQEEKKISVSQQSFDSQIESLTKLIELLTIESAYTPNETELQISTLQTKLGILKATNTEVINSYTNYSNAMTTRNSILYAPVSGLVDVALDVKKYVKSVYGASSPQYKQVSKIEFKNRTK
jgi:hypothetical protein